MRGPAGSVIVVALAACAHAPAPRPSIDDQLARADALFEAQRFGKARDAYDRAFAEAGGFPSLQAATRRASIELLMREHEACLAVTEPAMRAFPSTPDLLVIHASCLHWLDRDDEAIAFAEAALAAEPEQSTAAYFVARYYELRDPQRAVEPFRVYLAHRPHEIGHEDARIRILLGSALVNASRLDEGIKELRDVIDDRRVGWVAQRALCFAYARRGDTEAGFAACDLAREHDAGDPILEYALRVLGGARDLPVPLLTWPAE